MFRPFFAVFRPFLDVVRVPGAGLPLIAGFVGALPIGMLNLGVLLLVRDATGSLATAGAAVAALSIGNAVGLAVQGASIARWGQPRVLVAGAIVCPASLVGLVASADPGLMIACAALAGAGIPATTSSMRLLWPHLVADRRRRVAAYALLATQFQVALVSGPPLVSVLVLLRGPAAAVLAAAAVAAVGGLLFAAAPVARRWRPSRAASSGGGGRVTSGIWTLYSAAFLGGVSAGAVIVAVPAVAGSALAGLLFAAFSAGELVGGVVYGGRTWPLRPPARMAVCQAGAAVCLGVLAMVPSAGVPSALVPSALVPSALVLFVLGALTAPVAVTSSALLDDLADPRGLARAYPAMVAAGLIGVAAGTWAAGHLAAARGPGTALVMGAAVAAGSAVWTLGRRTSLTCEPS